ncbi:dihydrofolate reductase family protein [Actinopolymorpha pittospori]|uniref:Dihydrofolate reductase n=1 Tax=Actinopolymorpha pittospori TaxID=648752 RepID=A0A927R5G1_9ACTN|nr:dihydrofolate reductase family protein [Actinopolymorpha pittospori]MBE1603257.1 dihydrofolate reductase [Actinopolymorpha pittospori]
MRTLTVNTFVSLDGVMQAPGGPAEDPTGNFTLGGWNATFWDDVMGQAIAKEFDPPTDLLLGRKTYEIFAAHWPYISDDPIADQLNNATKYVASRTLDEVTWNNAVLLKGDAGDAVAELKHQDGPDLNVQGSSDLLQTLLRRDLVDVFNIWTFPILLGPGKRLFGEGTTPGGLRLLDSVTSTTGVTIAKYERAGEVPVGSFQFAEPTEAELRRRASLTD